MAERRWLRVGVRVGVTGVIVGALVTAVPFAWVQASASGHLYEEADLIAGTGPSAEVALVLGAQVAPGGTTPMPFLRGRLDTAAALVRDGRVSVLLVSGDAAGGSGNETAVMTSYLSSVGVDPAHVVADPHGLDTYDSCARARDVYGLDRVIVVTQSYHLARAVALCRQAGIDADGVAARCDDCRRSTLVKNSVRDYFASLKAAWDAWRGRPPAVTSPPSDAVAAATS